MPGAFRIAGTFQVEPSLNRVTGPAGPTRLEPKMMQVLVCLAEHVGEVIPKERLMQLVWTDVAVTDDVLTRCISELRRLFDDDPKQPRIIETIPKSGYRLIADVAFDVIAPEPASALAPGLRPRAWRVVAVVIVGAIVSAWLVVRHGPSDPVGAGALRTVPLTALPGLERMPSLSPDGSQVAFVWDGDSGNDDVYVQLVGAGTPLRLTNNQASDRDPAWSPDGKYIAFVRLSSEQSGLYVVPALGGVERRIAALRWKDDWDWYGAGLSWSLDGRSLIVTDRDTPEESGSLFVLSLDRAERRRLTSPSLSSARDVGPAISPDGRSVAFIRVTSGGISDVYLVPFSGGQPSRVTTDAGWLERVAWLPDGRELVYASGGALTGGALWRVSISGGTPARVAVGGDNATYPSISRSANRLAYVQRVMDANVWEVALSGRSTRTARMVVGSTRYEAGPQFSPDGRRIAFHSDRSGSMEIWACDSTGLNPLQLTSLGTSNTGTPRWSPDGKRIAFDARAGATADIFVIDADGGAPRRVTIEPSDDVVPSWSRDGRWIYFASKRSGHWEVWKVPADGGTAIQITRLGGFAAFESLDGRTLYYAKGLDVPGLWKVSVGGGEESQVLGFPKVGYWGYWVPGTAGIYYLNTDKRPYALEFHDVGTGRDELIASLPGAPVALESGLSLSPDERSILVVQQDRVDSDLVLAENFR